LLLTWLHAFSYGSECEGNQEERCVEFGEYSLRQYRYAKEYYKIAVEELAKKGETL
jgi:hypothetical protein